MRIIEKLEKFDLSKFEANIKNYHQQIKYKDSSLNFGYGNSPYFWTDADPTSSSEGISQVVYPNFQNENKIEWRNTTTRDLFFLYDITNRVYDENGNLIGGDLVWAKYNVSVQS